MGINKAIGKAIIERFAPTGMSANKIIRLAREQGGGYDRNLMVEDIRVAGQRFKNQYWVEQTGGNLAVSKGLMVETDLAAPRKYRVYGKQTYYDEETDDYYEETRSFYTDDLEKKDDWSSDYIDEFTEVPSQENIDIMGFSITAVEHNKGYGY